MARRRGAATAAAILILAAGNAWPEKRSAQAEASAVRNLKVSFAIRAGQATAAGNFIVPDGEQGNYVVAPGKTSAARPSVIVNCVPSLDPDRAGMGDVQLQLELSYGKGDEAVNFQFQTRFAVRLDKDVVLIDEPEKRLVFRVERADP